MCGLVSVRALLKLVLARRVLLEKASEVSSTGAKGAAELLLLPSVRVRN